MVEQRHAACRNATGLPTSRAVADFRHRWGFDPTGAIDQAISDGDYDLEGGTEEERAFIRELLATRGTTKAGRPQDE